MKNNDVKYNLDEDLYKYCEAIFENYVYYRTIQDFDNCNNGSLIKLDRATIADRSNINGLTYTKDTFNKYYHSDKCQTLLNNELLYAVDYYKIKSYIDMNDIVLRIHHIDDDFVYCEIMNIYKFKLYKEPIIAFLFIADVDNGIISNINNISFGIVEREKAFSR